MNIRFTQNGVEFDGTGVPNWKAEYKPREKKSPWKAAAIALPATILIAFAYFYVSLPAINIHSSSFWWMLIFLTGIFTVIYGLAGGFSTGESETAVSLIKKRGLIPAAIVAVSLIICVIGLVSGWVLLRADAYSKLLIATPGDFASEVEEVNWNQIPMLDSQSANTLANRKLGELADLVSQFEVDNSSAQINYQDAPVRVSYLNYGDIIKWWNNHKNGIPAYIVTDMRTQAVRVVRISDGISYSPSELFNHKIYRHLRFNFPFALFGDVNFEIDEEGTPWWIASVEKKTIGLFGGTDISGAVLCNAVTGECVYYDVADIPTWVDRVYDAELVMEQYNYYGCYHNGYINSLFGQKDCTVTTTGYNYIAMDDDVWIYTGITSVGGDESNIGFILVNQRTKEAHYYSCAGAEEYSGMSSAQGAVQQFSYQATFPILLNISGEPTYFMALRDASQLVKMYAMVNVHEYQIVATGSNVETCLKSYQNLLHENGIIQEIEIVDDIEFETVSGEINDIRTAVIDGNTFYYISLKDNESYFVISASQDQKAVLLDIGDSVEISFELGNDQLMKNATEIILK